MNHSTSDWQILRDLSRRWDLSPAQLEDIFDASWERISSWQHDLMPTQSQEILEELLDIDFLLNEEHRHPSLAIRSPRQDLGGKTVLEALSDEEPDLVETLQDGVGILG